MLKQIGIKTTLCFVFGAPGECKETIDETFAFIDKLQPDSVTIFTRIQIYKQSELAAQICVGFCRSN